MNFSFFQVYLLNGSMVSTASMDLFKIKIVGVYMGVVSDVAELAGRRFWAGGRAGSRAGGLLCCFKEVTKQQGFSVIISTMLPAYTSTMITQLICSSTSN